MLLVSLLLDSPHSIRYNALASKKIGPVAQLGARLNRTEEVRGSSPLRSTHEPPWYVGVFVIRDGTSGGINLENQFVWINRV